MLLQSIQSNFSVFTQTSVTPVTQDHVYSTNATQDHEISYYIMHYHAICQGNLTQCTVVQWMPFFKNMLGLALLKWAFFLLIVF